MSWFTALIGAPKVVGMVADTVKSGMTMWDNSKFTAQEQAIMGRDMMKVWLKIQEATASENSIRSVTRRILAWGIIGTFLSWVSFTCGIYRYNPEWATHVKETVVATRFGWMACSVVIFYFGYYGVKTVLGKKKKD